MKNAYRSILAVFVLAFFTASTAAVQGEDYLYETNNGTITITGYIGPGGDVVIPSTINGLPVTSIGNDAFLGFSGLISVSIPNSVTSIGVVTFLGCSQLTTFNVDTQNQSYSSLGGALFDKNQTALIRWPPGIVGAYTIPSSVTNIGDCAFSDCSGLTSVSIPNSVTSIGQSAFAACVGLTNVSIPGSVTNVGTAAFARCGGLTTFMVDTQNPSYTSLGGVLFDKHQTTLIACPGGKAGSYTVPSSVTFVGDHAFDSCAGLTNVTIPSSVTAIGVAAFFLSGLTDISIPDSVTAIGFGAFASCVGLTSVAIPDSVTSLGDGAFYGCSSLTSITIPSSVLSIGRETFMYCGGLNSVTIGLGVTSIGFGAFASCVGLTNVTIPRSVTSIGDCAFGGCSSLTSVTIPNSVTKIGSSGFGECTSLTEACFEGNAPTVGLNVFSGGTNATIYYLPGTIGWGTTFGERPTAPWLLPFPVILTTASNFGIQTNAFGLRISWTTNVPVVVETSTTLSHPVWSPLSTNVLVNGWSDFRDAEWMNYAARFYRIRQF